VCARATLSLTLCESTESHYNYFRDFDPSIGRYIQSDPIGLNAGLNTFGYSDGSPLNRFDPWGLEGAGPSFDGSKNGSESWLRSNNCYSYALNRSGALGDRLGRGGGLQPGGLSGKPFGSVTCADIKAAAKRDGAVEPGGGGGDCGGTCPSGYYKTKLVIRDSPFWNKDFHFFRQDNDGGWSSKQGAGAARQHGQSCPATPFFDYKVDCGVLCVRSY
jgi:RHS repeat-associated protein